MLVNYFIEKNVNKQCIVMISHSNTIANFFYRDYLLVEYKI